MCGRSTFTSASKQEFLSSMTKASSERASETDRSLSLKTSSTNFVASAAQVVVMKGLQNKNFPLSSCLSHSARKEQGSLDWKRGDLGELQAELFWV